MKKEIRVLGIDDSPFDKFKDEKVLVVGTFFRGGLVLDGVLSTHVEVDGFDSTDKLVEMINSSKFKSQLQCVLLDGIALGGFNVVNVERLHQEIGVPVVVVVRRKPDIQTIEVTLEKIGHSEKIPLIRKAGEPVAVGSIFIQQVGLDLDAAAEVIRLTTTNGMIPEPIRQAHLIASGVVDGESRGRA